MKNPKVSVIIPTYNREDLIKRSIDSLLKQTNQDFEIIIADDASTDNTEQVIKGFNDPRINYFKLEKNSGQCVSRNRAMKLAKGEYIGFLDSDDEWLPTKIEKQLNVFEWHKRHIDRWFTLQEYLVGFLKYNIISKLLINKPIEKIKSKIKKK